MKTVLKYKVNIIQKKGNSALIEWNDGTLKRAYIPVNLIENGYIDAEHLSLAIPYGVSWSDILSVSVTSQDFENALKQAGIWTYQDALENSAKVLNALMSVYNLELSKIQKIAKQQLEKELS